MSRGESPSIKIDGRRIGPGEPVFIVAEMSANHHGRYEDALRILEAAREAGADAVKIQTYTPDTMTFPDDRPMFRAGKGTLWAGRNLYDLYREAATPWDWQPKLIDAAAKIGLTLFSTPFDETAVEFLEGMRVPAYKIASFELVDLPLIQRAARTGKPIILSTGMATLAEIKEAVGAAKKAGAGGIVLLKCTSAYPAPLAEMNLRAIPRLARIFKVPVGLSDHTLEWTAPAAAVALGACLIEKHFTLSRDVPGPDSAFSLEPREFKAMVGNIRDVEKALGSADFSVGEQEGKSRQFRRSLFVVKDVKKGERYSPENVRSLRPADGLAPKFLPNVLGRRAARDIRAGTPLSRDMWGHS